MTLIDSIDESSNLLQDSANLQILHEGWIDQLETLDPKFGLNWRDRKSDIKKVPGQRKIFRLKSWSNDDKGCQKRLTMIEAQRSHNLIGCLPKKKSMSGTLTNLGLSPGGSKASTTTVTTMMTTQRQKSPTFKVEACLKELEMTGSVNKSIDKNVLINALKFLNDELKKLKVPVSPSRVAAAKKTNHPLKLPKLGKSV